MNVGELREKVFVYFLRLRSRAEGMAACANHTQDKHYYTGIRLQLDAMIEVLRRGLLPVQLLITAVLEAIAVLDVLDGYAQQAIAANRINRQVNCEDQRSELRHGLNELTSSLCMSK